MQCLYVSTSGYYNYLKNQGKRQERDEQDKKDYKLILKAYKYRNKKRCKTNKTIITK